MRLKLKINRLASCPPRDSFFVSAVRTAIFHSDQVFFKGKNISINLAIVSEKEIKKINRAYRGKNYPTDVLSFSEYKNTPALRREKSPDIFLGEIILCYNDIAKYCQKYKLDLREQLRETVAHAVLHLLGFRHGKKMFAVQKKVK